jgi:putative photosynthetic complex assembly protein 2
MPEFFSSVLGACTVALLSWWLGTGVILWLVRLPVRSFAWSMALMTVVLGLSLWGTAASMRESTVLNAYLGFVSVILMWSWHELAFLTGMITGPRKVGLDPEVVGGQRFGQSVMALLHHEVALLFNFLVLLAMQQGQPNHVALCTFALLWCMRLSAKLNLYFGVPQVGEQYLPGHLAYMASYFRRSRVTACYYLTMGLSVGAWMWLVWPSPADSAVRSTGSVLLASLLGLAIIEHLLMVFALPLQRLWGWAMSRGAETAPARPLASAGNLSGGVSSASCAAGLSPIPVLSSLAALPMSSTNPEPDQA